ncbi:sugar ABC transporter ATP-binding protein [Nakamurella sp. PAMC28650]|uniref:sugar ABC transporter ATP-binding protein n=1 Tax=Nakamurella sp. PAMC28650 TaxID=2762325 RepID=UPI00164D1EE2|nr:sugar ABC transporter ATP-binding protein [Nakamurella sp. PAMC28650]QNK82933.1 sugar ABC transporter ATP-binding protein [Nakamurella sp. PAMC28650]
MTNPTAPDDFLLELDGITKHYQGVTALNRVHLKVKQGEIHALLGGNGAGKSTLFSIISGLTVPDEGTLTFEGNRLNLRHPKEALDRGITTIYQELSLIPALTTLDNIFLGREVRSSVLGVNLKLDRKAMEARVRVLANEFGLKRQDLKTPIDEFGALKKRVIEIVKALAFDTRLLILDEPTSGLEQEERIVLFEHMRVLRERGISLIWVTHQIEELFGLADTATVLRDGRNVSSVRVSDTTTDELLGMMFGISAEEFGASKAPADNHAVDLKEGRREVLALKGVNRRFVLKDISLQVHEGEILGIAGLAGAGRTELARAIMGMDKITSGEVELNGKRVRFRGSSSAYKKGLALLPEDRKQLGILPEMSVAENMSISNLQRVTRFGFVLRKAAEARLALDYVQQLSIKTPNVQEKIRNLSGGNQQKVIVARCLSTDPSLVIFDEPTQGIDVSAKVEVHRLVRDFVSAGGSAIVIASEIEELLELAHRVVVMREGRIVGTVTGLPAKLAAGQFEAVKNRVLSLSGGKLA